jgi:hypothetical protein
MSVQIAWGYLTIIWVVVICLLVWYSYMNFKLSVIHQQDRFKAFIRRRESQRKDGIYDDDEGGGMMAMHDRAEDSLQTLRSNITTTPLGVRIRPFAIRDRTVERSFGGNDEGKLNLASITHSREKKVYQIRSTPEDRQRRRKEADLRKRRGNPI